MTNHNDRDLDAYDVARDAENMYTMEMERLSEEMEGADLYTVLSMIHGHLYPEMEFSEWMKVSLLAGDLIQYTQSNPARSAEIIVRLSELDQAISEL